MHASPVGGIWCITTAKDLVPVGTPFHAIGGEILAPSQVYFAGKIPFDKNTGRFFFD